MTYCAYASRACDCDAVEECTATPAEMKAKIDRTTGMLANHVDLAPAAQPADSAMEVLRELVAIKDLQRSRAQAERHASKFPTHENYEVVDNLWSEIARRTEPAWDRARALTAASKERSKTHE